MKIVVDNYEVMGRKFTICYRDGMYIAIEDCYIDESGKLTQELNGIQMYANKNLDDCLEQVRKQVEIQSLTINGVDIASAFCMVYNIPLTPEIQETFNACAACL